MTISVMPIPMELQLPRGAFGPEPMTVDVRAYLVAHPGGLVLVDTGLDPTGSALAAAIAESGATWADVTEVVVTHAHPDHVGALDHVRSAAPGARIMASSSEGLRDVVALEDGDPVGPLRVVDTAGHTPGHLSLALADGSVLLVGDSVGAMGGRLTRGPAAFTADRLAAERSMRRLLAWRGARTLFGHGAEIDDPWPALEALLETEPV